MPIRKPKKKEFLIRRLAYLGFRYFVKGRYKLTQFITLILKEILDTINKTGNIIR
jgi:hypothetical protein